METIIEAIAKDIIPIVLAIIGSSVISTILTILAERKLREADIRDKETAATERVVNIYEKTVGTLEERIRCIYKDLGAMKKENESLKKRLDELETQYANRIELLNHRVELLEKLFARIYRKFNGRLRDIAGGIRLSDEDIYYLEKIIEDIS